MSDAVKWGLLVAGALVVAALIGALPMLQFLDLGEFSAALSNIVDICADAFQFGRGLINNFLLPFGRKIVTGMMIWLVGKWAVVGTIKITTWVYHFIFK